ncbi:MAG TPA: quinone-dependent dihydroorotate dehydrogenase, partial [Microcoleaceae cyanobacterium]
MDIYRGVIRPILFSGVKADPEWLHQRSLQVLRWLDTADRDTPADWVRTRLQQTYGLTDPRLQSDLWGLRFPNPIGLAAGFDKDGTASGVWSCLGFGFAELGTVTFHAQPGNPKPRLFRLLPDRAALNRMGFNNHGAQAMADCLQERWGGQVRQMGKMGEENLLLSDAVFPIGINLGKSKITPLESAAADYLASFQLLKEWGDYFVVNVSSPNTPGLRSLQASDQLAPILDALQQENQGQKPLLVKIAPDLEWDEITAVVELAKQHALAGIIATNTTIERQGLKTQILPDTGNPIQAEAGGISGAPLRQRSTEVIRFIYQQTQGQ